jgi:hypothetical protein
VKPQSHHAFETNPLRGSARPSGRGHRKILASVGLSVLALAGCASHQAGAPLPFFPQAAPAPPGLDEVWLTAAFSGQVVIEKGCVKVRSPGARHGTTVLWYQGIALDRDESGLFLRVVHNGKVTRFDTPSQFGGGDVGTDDVETSYPDVARRCGPPYAYGYPANAYDAP